MIRFIDMRGQILLDSTDPCFAFFNTVPDTFVAFGGDQHWWSREDLLESMADEEPAIRISRYLRLIPEGYFNDP